MTKKKAPKAKRKYVKKDTTYWKGGIKKARANRKPVKSVKKNTKKAVTGWRQMSLPLKKKAA